MPNWVRNVVKGKGIHNLPIFTKDEETGKDEFDFEKIIPRPESLNVVSGSCEEISIMYYLTERCTVPLACLSDEKKETLSKLVKNRFARDKDWKQEIFQRAMVQAFEKREEEEEEIYQAGKTYVENYQNYGHTTWYGWNIANWGTKWNAHDTEKLDKDTIVFDTAWSAPVPVIEQLSKMSPEIAIKHWYADENMGSNTGCITYRAGIIVAGFDYDSCSNEAYETYIKCWGESQCLYKDEDGLWQHHDCGNTCHVCD